ncbi:outer membrane beta-barrel protein [Ideonella sp.]|uniref:outer membrane beta-barrel protein n=1 Tax=Ideonella sp. TaxID=1929293 RepID=UPI003BB55B71
MKKPVRNRPFPRVLGALALTIALVSIAHGADAPAPPGDEPGPYLGIGLGLSKRPRNEGKDGAHDERPGVTKLYGGYRLTETWGVEAGLVKLGRVHNDTTTMDGSMVHHNGEAHSLYLAGTGRLALGHDFSLTGKAGMSLGRVSAQESGDTNFTLGGDKASPLLGIGAEYKLTRNIALTFDLDGYGKVSETVKAAKATVGARFSF